MILDKQALVSDEQSIAASAGVVTGTNVIKLPGVNCADGARFIMQLDETVTSEGAATVQFKVLASAAENLGSPQTLFDSGATAKASLVAGTVICDIALPRGLAGKYLGCTYTVGTAATTAGKVTSGIVLHSDTNRMPGTAA